MDDLMNVISKINTEMSNYILTELNKSGVNDFSLSHGNILINFQNKEKMNYRELSRRVGKTPQTMTTLVRKLEKYGYLFLSVDQEDKRNKLVRLTEKGKAFLPGMFKISKGLYNIQYKDFSLDEKLVLKSLLAKLLNNFKGHDLDN
ncbi:HTH-type transcriptional regulator SarZ [Candidatus Izimaplasma bacterium HR1]|jgi:DNA-binding MarR family transcriptional regulator|uniref:MarR family winged helix-turn-helix transcriptional regulator n=1 Tax=Candidatus Izimoplasma sp. HR1 TaxID=1541959 RepID=UPI0004F80872|nr:HTH-type transcriptional regulator SarZ [Candidatus Izimaplasma bacterium HR1]